MDKYPKGRVVEVKATIVLPANATEEEVDDWISSCIFQSGGIGNDNPLLPCAVDVEDVEWEDTGTYRVTEISDVVKSDDGTIYYKSRRQNLVDKRSDSEVDGWKSASDVRIMAIKDASA